MRIASLLPACTEWVAAFGAADQLVGRSHACDYPPEVLKLPVLTRPHGDDVGERHGAVRDSISPFHVDLEHVKALRPDVILTQTLCGACAVTEAQLTDFVSQQLGEAPRIFSMSARTLKQVLSEALSLAQVIGRGPVSMRVIGELESRLHRLRNRLGLRRGMSAETWPTVAAIEWADPVMTAGHWTPDLIEMAGGRPVCASSGAPSEELDWSDLREADPDVMLLMPCSVDLAGGRKHAEILQSRPGYSELAAVRSGRVFLFDGNAYFNRPGPRLYRSIELIAAALHGDRAGIDAAHAEMKAVEL